MRRSQNILFALSHPAHLNFFKNMIREFSVDPEKNVFVSVLNRGKLPKIAKWELSEFNLPVFIVGRHRGTFLSIIFEANLLPLFTFMKLIVLKRIDVVISVGGFIPGFCMKVIFRRNLQFDDDPESGKNFFLERLTASQLFIPFYDGIFTKVTPIHTLKEWAYLSPKYFTPKRTTLLKYQLKEKEYIFLREVSTGSLNYMQQDENIILSISGSFPDSFGYVLSLENKSNRNLYPKNWIILEEPIEDIHSLIYYSKMVISSGDSMAREAAMLGVPAIYCGYRIMKANNIMIEKGLLFKVPKENVSSQLKELSKRKESDLEQQQFRNELLTEWVDINELIRKEINN